MPNEATLWRFKADLLKDTYRFLISRDQVLEHSLNHSPITEVIIDSALIVMPTVTAICGCWAK